MSLFPRCGSCNRRIWPWQHMGWIVMRGSTVNWHTRCKRPEWSK